ncbi:MAG: T9SS type A sorting domain-containing protein [Bacteroidota bacterium]|nr:T9SS type A sorting domain-containing protein [Bacteroidota bacterium]
MKNTLQLLLIFVCVSLIQGQTTYTWNGSTTAWNTNTNWTPNGIPGTASTDIVVINATAITPVLDANRTISNLTITNKNLNLNGNTLNVLRSAIISNAQVTNGTLYTYSSTGISNSNFTANLFTISTATGLFDMSATSTTGIVDVTFPGWSGAFSNNTISGSYLKLTKVVSGNTGFIGDQTIVNCPTTITAFGADIGWGACGSKHIFNSDLSLIVMGTNPTLNFVTCGTNQVFIGGNLYLRDLGNYNGGFNSEHMQVFRFGNFTVTGNVYFGINNTLSNGNNNININLGTYTNLNNMLLKVGGAFLMSSDGCVVGGTNTGSQNIINLTAFSQTASGVTNIITCLGTGSRPISVNIYSGTFAGPTIYTANCRDYSDLNFKSTAQITKSGTGTCGEYLGGNNIFNGVSTFINTSDNGIGMAYQGNGPDYYLSDAYFYSNPGGICIECENGGGYFAGDVYFGCTTSGGNIEFTHWNATKYTTILGALKLAPGGFTEGQIRVNNINQTNPAKSNVLSFSGNGNFILGDNHNNSVNTFAGVVSIIGSNIDLRGNLFKNIVYLEKTSNSGGWSSGGNTFNTTTTLVMSSQSGGDWELGGGNGGGSLSGDTYNGPLTIINSGNNTTFAFKSNAAQPLIFNNTVTALNLDNAGSDGKIGINCDKWNGNSDGYAYINNNFVLANTRQNGNASIYIGGQNSGALTFITATGVSIYNNTFTGGTLRYRQVVKTNITNLPNNITNLTPGSQTNNFQIYNCTLSGSILAKYDNTSDQAINFDIQNNYLSNNISIIGCGRLSASYNTILGTATFSTCGWNGFNTNNNFFMGTVYERLSTGGIGSTDINFNNNYFNTNTIIDLNSGNNWDKTSGQSNKFNGPLTITASCVGDLNSNTFAGVVNLINNGNGTTTNNNGNLFQSTVVITQNAANSGNTFQFGNGFGSNNMPNIFMSNVTFNGTGTNQIRVARANLEVYQGDIVDNTNPGLRWSSGGGTVSLTGTAIQSLTGVNSFLFLTNFTIDKSGGRVYQSNNSTVNGIFDLKNGIFDLSSKSLIMNSNNASNLTRTNGYVYSETSNYGSKFQWNISNGTGTFVYPFGNQDGTYVPMSVVANSGNFGNVWVSTYRPSGAGLTPYPSPATNLNRKWVDNSANVAKRFWFISATGVGFTAGAKFSIDVANESAATAPASYVAQRWNNSALPYADWDPCLPSNANYAVASGVGTVTLTTVAGFSPWALVGSVYPLPLGFLDFNITQKVNNSVLYWKVNNQEDIKYFEIEKSNDGANFKSIGKVSFNKSSKNESEFSFTDKVESGTTFYRILKVLGDGESEYSEIKSVNYFSDLNTSSIEVYPNPVKHLNDVYIAVDKGNFVKSVIILNSSGAVVRDVSTYIHMDDNTIAIPSPELKGVYFLKIITNDHTKVLKLLVE